MPPMRCGGRWYEGDRQGVTYMRELHIPHDPDVQPEEWRVEDIATAMAMAGATW